MIASACPFGPAPDDPLHAAFLSILGRIKLHARIFFRHVKCPHRKDDYISETVAIAWKWFRLLALRGKDTRHFPSALASLAARHVQSGRRLCGQEKSRDVLNALAQQRHRFVVLRLPDYSTLTGTPIEEALQDNRKSEVPTQVAFRLDFAAWLADLAERDRRMVLDMAVGEPTHCLARKYGISAGRVSQKRRQFQRYWLRHTGEDTSFS